MPAAGVPEKLVDFTETQKPDTCDRNFAFFDLGGNVDGGVRSRLLFLHHVEFQQSSPRVYVRLLLSRIRVLW